MFRKFFVMSLMVASLLPLVAYSQGQTQRDYYGTWKKEVDGKYSDQITITANKLDYLNHMVVWGSNVVVPFKLTVENLTWEAIENTDGYKVTGTVTSIPSVGSISIYGPGPDGGMGTAKVGDTAVNWLYLRESKLMTGNLVSASHEAISGPFIKQ